MKRTFDAELWEWEGDAAWHFVTLPTDIADDIADVAPAGTGFGSVRVEVTVGGTTWRTSLFPDKKTGSYVLPVKKSVRQAESLTVGDAVTVTLLVL